MSVRLYTSPPSPSLSTVSTLTSGFLIGGPGGVAGSPGAGSDHVEGVGETVLVSSGTSGCVNNAFFPEKELGLTS